MIKTLLFAATLFLAGCTSMTAPRNAGDSLAYAQGQVTAVRDSCTEAGQRGQISKEDSIVCLELANEARKVIEFSRTLTNPVEKQAALQYALDLLVMIQKALDATIKGGV